MLELKKLHINFFQCKKKIIKFYINFYLKPINFIWLYFIKLINYFIINHNYWVIYNWRGYIL